MQEFKPEKDLNCDLFQLCKEGLKHTLMCLHRLTVTNASTTTGIIILPSKFSIGVLPPMVVFHNCPFLYHKSCCQQDMWNLPSCIGSWFCPQPENKHSCISSPLLWICQQMQKEQVVITTMADNQAYISTLFKPRITPYNLRNSGLNIDQNSYNSSFFITHLNTTFPIPGTNYLQLLKMLPIFPQAFKKPRTHRLPM